MSGIIVVSPLLLAAPVVMAAAAAAASSLGFTVCSDKVEDILETQAEDNVVGFDVTEAPGLKDLLQNQGSLVLRRPDATVVIREKGSGVHMEVSGQAQENELENLGRDLLQSINQHYAYDRVVSDLKNRGFEALDEEVEEDGTIRLKLRRWDS
jgi:hypothetical protein